MNNNPIYATEQIEATEKLRYLFESIGIKTIIKVIEYTPVKKLGNRVVYNLGFGDLDETNSTILDDINSNNGDVYLIFNTVLNTVPSFFEAFPDAIIMVGGSDGSQDFIKNCFPICKKRCTTQCKNFQRRTRTYRNFVDKYFDELCKDYIFLGKEKDRNIILQYHKGQEYNEILVYKKKII